MPVLLKELYPLKEFFLAKGFFFQLIFHLKEKIRALPRILQGYCP